MRSVVLTVCESTAITLLCAYSYFLIPCWYCAPFFCATDCFHVAPALFFHFPFTKVLHFGRFDLACWNMIYEFLTRGSTFLHLKITFVAYQLLVFIDRLGGLQYISLLWVCIFTAISWMWWRSSNTAVCRSAVICCCHMASSNANGCGRVVKRESLVAGRWAVGKRT